MSVFGGTGRPSSDDSNERRLKFLRLVSEGTEPDAAARAARISTERALKILAPIVQAGLKAAA